MKLLLDEDLFDDVKETPENDLDLNSMMEYDDDFSADNIVPEEHLEDAPSGPKDGVDTGVTDLVISAINDEFEAIQFYNSLIATMRANVTSNPQYDAFIKVVEEINNEENRHVGQLQQILKELSPNAESIADGEAEGKAQIVNSESIKNIQFWEDSKPTTNKDNPISVNEIDDTCTLQDVDDEW